MAASKMTLLRKVAAAGRQGRPAGLFHSITPNVADIETKTTEGRTIWDLPGPTAWPVVGNFGAYVKKENRGKLHELQARQHRQYGVIFKEKLGLRTNVHVCDPDHIAQVFRSQGPHPIREPLPSWVEHRRFSDKECGILTAQGEEWWQIRRVLSQRMLKPKLVPEFDADLNEVLRDMVVRLRDVRDRHGDENLTTALPNELYKWAFESIGTILFETRMGCLQDTMPERTQEFIHAIAVMMMSSLPLIIGESLHRRLNTSQWRTHEDAWNKLFELAQGYVDARLEMLKPGLKSGEEMKGEFLTYLLSSGSFSMQDIYANITEVMLGGIDTTSNTLCFALHLLAQHPEVQQRLHAEVTGLVGQNEATAEDVKAMTYLKCIVKETLRLYPVVTMNVRLLPHDITILGYTIPKGTMFVLNHYAACREERLFPYADQFRPERWDRQAEDKIHPFAAMPFGFGIRSCIGRRVAELELYLALARISQTFHVRPYEGKKFEPYLRTVLTPGDCVPVRLLDR